MTDYSVRRRTMVDTQVRPADVTKFPIIDAMLAVPRELFVPLGRREAAYVGENLPIGRNRVVLEPRTLAKMLDALDIQPGELVLDVGAGLGYSSAVIARLAEAVVALEEDAALFADAERTLGEGGFHNVIVVQGRLADGAPQHGPYDAITVEGAIERLPDAIADQLKENGRIGAVFLEGRLGICRIGYKTQGRITWRPAFNAAAPVLPGFEARRAFVL